MAIKSLGYIGVNSTDLSQWRSFACDVMGLEDVSAHLECDDRKSVQLLPNQWSRVL